MFKCTYFRVSGPHTSQTGERIFKTLDDLKTSSTSVSDKHLSQRLLHAMNNVKENQAYRKKLAAARAAEKTMLKASVKASIEAMETEDKVDKRLRQTDASSKVAVTFALAQCKEHYPQLEWRSYASGTGRRRAGPTMLKGKFMSTVTWSMRRNTRTRSARVTQMRF